VPHPWGRQHLRHGTEHGQQLGRKLAGTGPNELVRYDRSIASHRSKLIDDARFLPQHQLSAVLYGFRSEVNEDRIRTVFPELIRTRVRRLRHGTRPIPALRQRDRPRLRILSALASTNRRYSHARSAFRNGFRSYVNEDRIRTALSQLDPDLHELECGVPGTEHALSQHTVDARGPVHTPEALWRLPIDARAAPAMPSVTELGQRKLARGWQTVALQVTRRQHDTEYVAYSCIGKHSSKAWWHVCYDRNYWAAVYAAVSTLCCPQLLPAHRSRYETDTP
jgi:hypothetical protein